MQRKPAAVVLIATVIALLMPLTLAVATSAFAQEPEPPTGEPQPGDPDYPLPPEPEPEPQPPGGGEAPGAGGGGELPRTGWDAFAYLAAGLVLLLAGARLRVLTRIREVGQRVSARLRRRPTDVALREALEPIRVARMSRPDPNADPGPLHVEPSTPTARRLTGVADE